MELQSVYESIHPRYPEFEGRVALVTGSSRGIGKGIALRLAREGMKIVLHGMLKDEVEQSVQDFRALGAEVVGFQSDFNDPEGVNQLFESTLEAFGTVNLLVNNAAYLRRYHLLEGDEAILDQHLAVNIRAPYVCSLRAAEIMRPLRQGNIINISSVGGSRAHWQGLPYDVTKGSIDAMTSAMSLDLARDGIRVNAIAPGAIQGERTPPLEHPKMQELANRIPAARLGSALEIGSAVAFLASSDASYITGQILYVDGGITAQLSPPGQPI